jgi:hypothetical protein
MGLALQVVQRLFTREYAEYAQIVACDEENRILVRPAGGSKILIASDDENQEALRAEPQHMVADVPQFAEKRLDAGSSSHGQYMVDLPLRIEFRTEGRVVSVNDERISALRGDNDAV